MSNFGVYKSKRKYHFIYKTTNLINGRYYYGMHSTDDLNDNYFGSGARLWKAIKKYGKENFKREIVEFCEDREELVAKEKEIVSLNEIAKKECMNIKLGGDSGGFFSKEHQQKCSKAGKKAFNKKLKNDKEFATKWKKMVSERNKEFLKTGKLKSIQQNYSWIDKKHTPETIEKMKKAHKGMHKGKLNSQFGTIWITNGKENKKILKTDQIPNNWNKGRISF